MRRGIVIGFIVCGVFSLYPHFMWAAQIGDITETTWQDQAMRFISLEDPSVRYAILGVVLLGVCCGLLGSFIVVRKMSLLGDTMSHAVLPGVALGFLWNMSKDPLSIFIGATLAGVLGASLISFIKQTTILKEDTIMGMVLAGFYGLGVCLMSMIQNLPMGNKAGLDKFMFGQAAALSQGDIKLMALLTLIALGMIVIFYKEYLAISFDFNFAKSVGIAVHAFHYSLILLLTFAIVVSLQAVGVVLVSAMLITPAAAAYLLSDRMPTLLMLAMLFGMLSGVCGALFSFLGPHLPTGPFIVISASMVFLLAFLFGARHGLIPRWIRHKRRKHQIQLENTLKGVYHVREANGLKEDEEGVSFHALEVRMNEPLAQVEKRISALIKAGLATQGIPENGSLMTEEKYLYLTPKGWERACEIVRNHRLWELYLTHAMDYALDHVHEDAEVIEHVLGEETVRRLEERLNYPTRDPHGKPIPGVLDLKNVI